MNQALNDGDFVVLTFGGKVFTRHRRAFEALRECDHLIAQGIPAFFMGHLQYRLDRGEKR